MFNRLLSSLFAIAFAITSGEGLAQTGTPKSKATLSTEISSCFPDNVVGAITPAIMRSCMQDFLASWQQYAAVRQVPGTTDTIVASDYGQIVRYTSASAISTVIPVASGATFGTFNVVLQNAGTNTITVTPTSGTVGGSPTVLINAGTSALFIADGSGTNWDVITVGGGSGPFLDATSFGVKCDGVFDNATAITASIASGRPVILPAGTCVIKSQVTYTSAATVFGQGPQLYGQGREKTIIDNQTGSYAFLVQGSVNGDYAQGTIFSNFEITSTTNTAGAGGIECYRCWYTTYENLHFINMSGSGIYMPAFSGDPDAAIQIVVDRVRMDNIGIAAGGWCMNLAAPTGGFFGSQLTVNSSNFATCGVVGTAAVPPTTGGVSYTGLIATFTNTSWTTNSGPDLYIAAGSGSSILVTLTGADFENNKSTVLPHVYTDGGIFGFRMTSSQCINNDSFVSQGCVLFATAGGGAQNIVFDNIEIQASAGNSTYTAFKITGTNAWLDTIRATNIYWKSFDLVGGQVRFSGFLFNPIPGQATFSISGVNVAQLIPTGLGAVMPMKLKATGEWVAYHVPVAGITASGIGGLAASTRYFFYLYNSAATTSPVVGAIEVSASAYVLEGTEGYAVKSGDTTRTFIGSAVTDGAGNFGTGSAQSSWYPNQTITQLIVNGTAYAPDLAGQVVIAGLIATPVLTANGQAYLYTGTLGALLQGRGSVNDVTLLNRGANVTCNIPTGTTTFNCVTLTLTNPLAVAQGGTGSASGLTTNTALAMGSSAACGALAANTTYYFPVNGCWASAGNEAVVQSPMPQAGTVKNLYVVANAAAGAGQNYTMTVRKNLAATTITCQISGASATTCNDTTHTVSYVAGDTIDLQVVTSAASAVPLGINSQVAVVTTSP